MRMKKIWTRKPKEIQPQQVYIKGFGTDNYSAIPVRVILPDAPMKIDHTVIHTPYPKPTQIVITFYDNEGRSWVMPPIQCRGGAFYMNSVPHRYESQEWVRYDLKLYYD